MKDGSWTASLQRLQETGGGLAPRAGQPGMGASGFPYAKGLMASDRSGIAPRSVPLPPGASLMSSSAPTPPSPVSTSPGASPSIPPGVPGMPPELAQQMVQELYASLKAKVEARRAGRY